MFIKKQNKSLKKLKNYLYSIDSNWNFLFVGHWLSGRLGEDRKDTGMLVKVFLETFKNPKESTRFNFKNKWHRF